MRITQIPSSLVTPLSQFLSDPETVLRQSGTSAVTVFHDNQPYFHVLTPESWTHHFSTSMPSENPLFEGKQHSHAGRQQQDSFLFLSQLLTEAETQRTQRGEINRESLGILKNRLNAHVLPFFAQTAPSQTDHSLLEKFVRYLAEKQMSSTTISQYLVILRKLFKLAARHKLLHELPEIPKIQVIHRPRSMLSVAEYKAMVQTAHRLLQQQRQAPQIKQPGNQRRKFWIAPKHLTLHPDMVWAIRFMVNSFIRPGDLRQLKHKHVQICRGEHLYLKLNAPETKRHDGCMVTLRPAVHVYEKALSHAISKGFGKPDDYVFLPAEKDREYALAILGFWFKWIMREAGLATEDAWGRPRTLYCLRHTSIMFRLLYGQGIDMLTLARNARTSVQMIERFYASSLDGEMNVGMLQSRRNKK
jgi:integrase